jgi:STE24 endopeptidase
VARRTHLPGSGALRLGAVAVAAVIVAEAAVWVLRPRGEVIEPAPVSADAYFTEQQLQRSDDFREVQRWLGVGGVVVSGAVLVVVALWRPPPLRRALDAASRRPVIGGAAVGGAISLGLAVADLPLSAIAHERAVDVGLATQDLPDWLRDQGGYGAIGAFFAALGGAAAMILIRRLGRRWWAGGAVIVVGFAAATTWLAPVLIAPLFNDFEELPPGRARDDVLRLGERAGVEIGEVYEVDASRRSTGLNAYVGGLGTTKRVVLYDNLLREQPPPVVNSVIAHELAHVKEQDVLRGIAFVALVAPLGVLFVQLAGEAVARRTGDDPRSPAVIPALALVLSAATLVLGAVGLQLSRKVEARADTFALELTANPRAFIELQRELTLNNVSDPDPPAAFRLIFGSHPTTVERIGMAVAFQRAAR